MFLEALPVIKRIESAGYEAYFVGGSVRDALLGLNIHDVDIASSAFPAEIKELFKNTIDIGIEHGTVMIVTENDTYEVTTFRTESTYQDYRRPDEVTFVRSLKEDLNRRDFTINALAMNQKGRIIDYFFGLEDLNAKIIRAVGIADERFNEDALRMMRAVRFESQLGFELEDKTASAILKNHKLLEKISVERIRIEWIKMLLGQDMKKGLKSFINTKLYESSPLLEDKKTGIERLLKIKGRIETEVQAWTLIGEACELEEKEFKKFLRAWKCSNRTIQESSNLLHALSIRKERALTDYELYHLNEQALKDIEHLLYLLGYDTNEEHINRYRKLPIHHRDELAINGGIILEVTNKKAGKWLGDLIVEIERSVVEGEVENDTELLLELYKDDL